MLNFGDFLMLFSRNLLIWASIDIRVDAKGAKGAGVGWVVVKAKKIQGNNNGRFKVAVTSKCTNYGPLICYKALH